MLFQKTQKRSSAFARYGNLCEGYKINKPLSGLLVYRLIMSLAERLSLKYYICPRSFASQPNINFLDNLSRRHYQPTYQQLKGVIYRIVSASTLRFKRVKCMRTFVNSH